MRKTLFLSSILLFFFFPQVSLAATNLLVNPGGETGDLTGWTATVGLGIISGHDNNWSLTNAPTYVHSGTYSFDSSYACSTSTGPCNYDVLSQEINLDGKGYSGDEMDNEPKITVGTFVIGLDAGSGTDDPYRVKIELRDKNHQVVATYDTGDQITSASWTAISHEFTNYGEGVRYIYFELNGRSSAWWDGNYGATFDDSSVILGDVSGDRADIDSWKSSLSPDQSSCPQKLKLTLKGKHFSNHTQVSIGDKDASSVDKRSSKELIAKFCLKTLLQHEGPGMHDVSVKNPGTAKKTADKRIDLNMHLGLETDITPSDSVSVLQTLLVKLGYLDSKYVTGIYGPYTANAIKKFQADNGLDQTERVGPLTKAKLTEKSQ